MNQVKRLLLLAVAMCMVLGLCACASEDPKPTENNDGTSPVASDPAASDEATEPGVEDGKVVYTVKVQDEDGNPVVGAMVQICLEACLPTMTNDQGVATWTMEEAGYKVSFVTLPAGYDYATDAQEFYFADGAYEMTLTLKAVA